MPNWITNKIFYHPDMEKKMEQFFTTNDKGKLEFDFNTIVPMPKTIEEAKEKYPSYCNLDPLIEKMEGLENFDWYSWRYDHWGTKWNACETEWDKEHHCIIFDTPWCAPHKIFEQMMHILELYNIEYHEAMLMIAYADEDSWGENTDVFMPLMNKNKINRDEMDDDELDKENDKEEYTYHYKKDHTPLSILLSRAMDGTVDLDDVYNEFIMREGW